MKYERIIEKLIRQLDKNGTSLVAQIGQYKMTVKDQIGAFYKGKSRCLCVVQLHKDDFPNASDRFLMDAGFTNPCLVMASTKKTVSKAIKKFMDEENTTCANVYWCNPKDLTVHQMTAIIKKSKNGANIVIIDGGNSWKTKASTVNRPEKWWKNVRYNSGLEPW